jgi:stalled ribosome rescue protein Dom34
VDIFRCTPDGSIKLDGNDYLEQAIERKSISRVVGKVADVTKLSVGELTALAQGNANAFRAAKQEVAERGKTRANNTTSGKNKNFSSEMASAKLIAQAREVITTIVENLDIIVKGTGTHNINQAFKIVEKTPEHQQAIAEEFGVDFDLIKELFDHGVINVDLVELQVDQ